MFLSKILSKIFLLGRPVIDWNVSYIVGNYNT